MYEIGKSVCMCVYEYCDKTSFEIDVPKVMLTTALIPVRAPVSGVKR